MLNQSSDHDWVLEDWAAYVQDTLILRLGRSDLTEADIKRFSKTFKRLSLSCSSLCSPSLAHHTGLQAEGNLPKEMQQKSLLDFISVLKDV